MVFDLVEFDFELAAAPLALFELGPDFRLRSLLDLNGPPVDLILLLLLLSELLAHPGEICFEACNLFFGLLQHRLKPQFGLSFRFQFRNHRIKLFGGVLTMLYLRLDAFLPSQSRLGF